MKKTTILSVVASSLLFVTSIANANSTTTTTTKIITVKELKAQLKKEIKSELLEELKAEIAKSVQSATTAKAAEQKVLDTKHKKYTFDKLLSGASHGATGVAAAAPSATKGVKVSFKLESGHDKDTVAQIVSKVAGAKASKATAPTKANEGDAFDYKVKPVKVAENVWCFFGALDKPTKENAGYMVNSCYIKTNDGYLAMDTGPSYQFAKQTYEAMQKIEDLPVKYVVNSHEHDDHWLGNDFFKKKFGAELRGPESINKNYKDGDQTRMFKILPKNAIEGTHIIDLDKIVKKRQILEFGGEKFEIIPMDVKAHTGDDVFIYMPERKVLFAGDLVMNGRITSNRHGSVMGQIKALQMMKKLDWNVLVPGHGLITNAKAMDESNLYFKLMKEKVLEAIEEGVDATEINDVVKLEEFKDKAMYDILNAHNVGFAYDELEMLEDE